MRRPLGPFLADHARTLPEAMAADGAEAKSTFEAMMEMTEIDVARIDAAWGGVKSNW